jgi:hypothetical protein
MKEYLLIFRADFLDIATVSSEEMQERNNRWIDWIEELIDKNAFAEDGNHLTSEGKVLNCNGQITDGPFREIKESVLGYIIINASSFDEAVELTKDCPILAGENTSVEVREIIETWD